MGTTGIARQSTIAAGSSEPDRARLSHCSFDRQRAALPRVPRPPDLPGVPEVSQLSSRATPDRGALSVASRASSGQPLALLLDRCGSDATSDAFACWSGGRTDAVSALTFESPLAPNLG